MALNQRLSRRGGEPAPSLESALEDFLLGVHRLSTAIGESALLTQSGIGISEWAVLKVLGGRQEFQQHVLRKSGVSRQRIRKLLQELEVKKMVTIMQSNGDDKRQRIIAATPRAREARLSALAGLTELVLRLDTRRGQAARDSDKLAKRLQNFAQLSDRISKAIRLDAKQSHEDWPEEKTRRR